MIGPVRSAVRTVSSWTVTPLDLSPLPAGVTDALCSASGSASSVSLTDSGPTAGPAFHVASLRSAAGVDHFLSMDGWAKGLVWVNDFLLGRYWSAGPQETLHIPGPLLTGDDRVVVLELQGSSAATLSFVGEPRLGHTEL